MRGSLSCLLFVWAALPISGAAAPSEDALLPPYADEAFPVETRPAERARLAGELAKAKTAATETDRLVSKACARLPRGAFERVRFERRREVRARTVAFAERYLARGDATGLGFAEQALADLELMDRILREEVENLAKNPRHLKRPVVLHLAKFGAVGDGKTDDAPAFERAFEAVRKLGGRPSILKLGEGTFHLGSAGDSLAYLNRFGNYEGPCKNRANLPVCNLENCLIEGEGTDRTSLRFGVYDKPGMVFLNCRNCTLAKVECSYAQMPFLEGKVLKVVRNGDLLAVDIALTPGALRPDAPSWNPPYTWGVESFGYEFTEGGDMIQEARLLHWDSRNPKRCQSLGSGNWRLFFRRDFDPDNFDLHLPGIRVGGYLAIPNRCNAFPTLRLMDCSHQLIEDVWVSNSRAGAIDAYYHSFMPSFHRFRVAPRPGFRQATNADGCFCAPGTFLLDCSFEAMGDDGMNSLSNITRVRTANGGLAVEREREWGTNPIGSLVVFFDPEKGQYLANRRVGAAGEPNGKITNLDRAVPPSVDGKVMIAPRFRGIGTIVSKCRWKNGRWTGVVIQTPDALVEDCTFDNLHQEAVRMCFFGDWNEGLPPYNVLVRDCSMANGEKGVTSVYRQPGPDGKLLKPKAAPMRAIDVTGCAFRNLTEGAIAFENAGDCSWASNTFRNVRRERVLSSCEEMPPAAGEGETNDVLEKVTVELDLARPTHAISKNLYGLFIEDISQSVDGCFYPELVWNRGFDFPASPTVADPNYVKNQVELDTICGWKSDCRQGSMGRFTLQYAKPRFEQTPAYLRIEAFAPLAGVRNYGAMDEMSVRAGVPLQLRLYARGVPLTVLLEDEEGKVLASADFAPKPEWTFCQAVLTPKATVRKAHLSLLAKTAGTLDLEQVSLMPAKRFRDRQNGLREDIGTLMANLHPATFRFPGGCMLEGVSFDSWYDWKRSVGPVEERMPLWNCWGYYQTLGLGYYEYFQFCEDIGASPVPVFAAAMTCQNRKPEYAPMSAVGSFIDNVLDGIEFVRGDVKTKWGALRAQMGHPAPFRLEYVGIGNENRGPEYWERYNVMAKAVRAAHPDLKIVASVDHRAYYNRKALEYSWANLSKANADIADEHLYASPSWWLNNSRMYDGYERKGVEVYVGEWATRNASDEYINSLYNAVAEAAFKMGFERNADLVKMTAYAPLIRRVGVPGNRYSLIQLDGLGSCGAPAYWCEKMFADNRPDRLVPCRYERRHWRQPAGVDNPKWFVTRGAPAIDVESFHAVAGLRGGELIVKLANAAWKPQPVRIALGGAFPKGKVARTVLCDAPEAKNTPREPLRVVPREDEVAFGGGDGYETVLPACSVTILRWRR